MWRDEYGEWRAANFTPDGLEDLKNVNLRDRRYYNLILECRNVFWKCLLCSKIYSQDAFVEHLVTHIKDRSWVLRIIKGELSDDLKRHLLNYCGDPIKFIPLGIIKVERSAKKPLKERIEDQRKREYREGERTRFTDWKDEGGCAADYGGTKGLSDARKVLRRSDLKATQQWESENPGVLPHRHQGQHMGESGRQTRKVETVRGRDEDGQPVEKAIDFAWWPGDFSAPTRNYSYPYATDVWPEVLERVPVRSKPCKIDTQAVEVLIERLTNEPIREGEAQVRLLALQSAFQDLDHILYQDNRNFFPAWMLPFVEDVCRSVGVRRREDWLITELVLTRPVRYGKLARFYTLAEIARRVRRRCRRRSYSGKAASDRIDLIIRRLDDSLPCYWGGNRDAHERMLQSLKARQRKNKERRCCFCHDGVVEKHICTRCGVMQYIGKNLYLKGWDKANIELTGVTWQWLNPDEHWRTWPDYEAALTLRDRIRNIPIGLNLSFYKRIRVKTSSFTISMRGIEPFFLPSAYEISQGVNHDFLTSKRKDSQGNDPGRPSQEGRQKSGVDLFPGNREDRTSTSEALRRGGSSPDGCKGAVSRVGRKRGD